MSKTIDTLVEDIYSLMETKRPCVSKSDAEEIINDFGKAMRDLLRKEFVDRGNWDGRKLRLSSIGKKDRQLWYSYNGYKGEKLQPHTLVKFQYGNILEEMLLTFAKLAGHTVTDQQAKCEVAGIIGHQDCKIDGTLVDVKSASSYSFKKFEDGSLVEGDNDPFGYQAQLDAYAHSNGLDEYAWFAIDKGNGHLTVLKNDANKEIEKRVEHVKNMVKELDPPQRCYEPVPDGKSGNMKLATGCSYCSYKHHCWSELRTFIYSTGPRFLTTVVNEPNVPEVHDGKF